MKKVASIYSIMISLLRYYYLYYLLWYIEIMRISNMK